MGHLLYLMFRCDFDVMKNLESLEELGKTKYSPSPRGKYWRITRIASGNTRKSRYLCQMALHVMAGYMLHVGYCESDGF